MDTTNAAIGVSFAAAVGVTATVAAVTHMATKAHFIRKHAHELQEARDAGYILGWQDAENNETPIFRGTKEDLNLHFPQPREPEAPRPQPYG